MRQSGANSVRTLAYVFLGWVIGWTSASIARVVYPAPKWTFMTRKHRDQALGG
jgi:hypothetical protein